MVAKYNIRIFDVLKDVTVLSTFLVLCSLGVYSSLILAKKIKHAPNYKKQKYSAFRRFQIHMFKFFTFLHRSLGLWAVITEWTPGWY